MLARPRLPRARAWPVRVRLGALGLLAGLNTAGAAAPGDTSPAQPPKSGVQAGVAAGAAPATAARQAATAGAQRPASTPTLPAATGLLVDEAGWLDEDARTVLTQRLEALQASGRAQAAVLLASDTRGMALPDFSLQVAQSWQLGRAGRDDGLLVVIVPSRRSLRIEVGYGLEGNIPDLKAREWIDEFKADWDRRPAVEGLHRLLDRMESALPPPAVEPSPPPAAAAEPGSVLDRHPEWKLPFLIAVFSPFTLFPLFFGAWGALASAPMFAAAMGTLAWLLWGLGPASIALATVSLVLPPLWRLNADEGKSVGTALRWARAAANLIGVGFFFGLLSLFVGVGLEAMTGVVWPAFLFAGLLSMGLAVFLFPGEPARYLMLVLRSAMHFCFLLLVIWLVLSDHLAQPTLPALLLAGALTGLTALGLHLSEAPAGSPGRRAAHWLTGTALAVTLPFGLILLWKASGGADPDLQAAQAVAGGGSIGAVLWGAVRTGLVAAVRVGLGGRFGGGGASSSD